MESCNTCNYIENISKNCVIEKMKDKYLFYYDESGHSRRITRNTIFSDNYADYFVATIIGYNARYRDKVEQDYILLEKGYTPNI